MWIKDLIRMNESEALLEKTTIRIRRNKPKDDAQIEKLIRTCLIEFDGIREGTAWYDPYLGRFSEVYNSENSAYWVAVDKNENVICGVGIGPVKDALGVCELQKMYAWPEYRGTGLAQKMLDIALDFAKEHYSRCYLETFANMLAAHAFYKRNGFECINHFVGDTGHHACEVKMIKNL